MWYPRCEGVNYSGTITVTLLVTCTCTSSFMSHGMLHGCMQLYGCTLPLELCSTGCSKFPLVTAPLPRPTPHWQPSHIRNNPQAVIAIKKNCLSGWKQQSQWIHTTMGSEVNKMPQNSAPIVKQKRNQFNASTHLFPIFSCFDALEIFGPEFCCVLRQYVMYRWLLKIAFGNYVRKHNLTNTLCMDILHKVALGGVWRTRLTLS